MGKKKSKSPSAADTIRAIPVARLWFDRISPESQVEMLEIRRQYRIDKLGGKSMQVVLRWCLEHMNFTVSRSQFTAWMKMEDADDKAE